MLKSVEELAKIGITVEDMCRVLGFSKDKKYHYNKGREISLSEYYKVVEESGWSLVPVKKGKKIIIVEEEKEA